MAAAVRIAPPALSRSMGFASQSTRQRDFKQPSLLCPWKQLRGQALDRTGRCPSDLRPGFDNWFDIGLASVKSLRSSGRAVQKLGNLKGSRVIVSGVHEQANQEKPAVSGKQGVTSNSLKTPLPGVSFPSKLCGECKHWKVKADFEKTRATADGLQDWCRACLCVFRLKRASKEPHHLAMSPEEAWAKSKACVNCGLVKELRDFGKNTARKGGLQYWCRGCVAEAASQKRRVLVPKETPLQCTSCKEVKPAEEFYADPLKKSGRSSHCKSCHKVRIMLSREERRRSSENAHMPRAEKRCTACCSVKPSAEFSRNNLMGLTGIVKFA